MRRTSSELIVLLVCSLLISCGSDSKQVENDTGPDAEVDATEPDAGVDVEPDLEPDLALDVMEDSAPDQADDQIVSDGLQPDTPSTRPNASCDHPETIVLDPSGTTTKSDSVVGLSNEYPSIVCGTLPDELVGPQLYYRVSLEADSAYQITMTPDEWDGALYAFPATTACDEDAINNACIGSISDTAGNNAEAIRIIPTTDEDWIIVVDSWSGSSEGPFDLVITKGVATTNPTCSTAETITITGGTGSATGDSFFAPNEFASDLDCGVLEMPGAQLYYKASLKAGNVYKVVATSDATTPWDPGMYAFPSSTTCAVSDINAACEGYLTDVEGNGPEVLVIAPTIDEEWTFVVDAWQPALGGPFTITITEGTAEANATCAGAQAVTLSGTPPAATVIGDNSGLSPNEFGDGITCGDQYAYDGPQLYYTVALQGGHAYSFKVASAALTVFTLFTNGCDAATIETDCTSNGATGDAMWVNKDTPMELLVRPTADTTYTFAVDSISASLTGAFTVEITEKAMVPTFDAPLTFNFDGACQDLLATNDWECGALAFTAGAGCEAETTAPTAAHSGTGTWGTKLNDCYSNLGNHDGIGATTCSNTRSNDDSILAFKVAIPSAWKTAELKFWSWDDINGMDWAEVAVDGVGVVSTQVCSLGYTAPTDWVEKTVDLAAHIGKTITISFHMMSSSEAAHSGWYIDDLSVSGS